jgi:hypothetical protein
MNCPGLHCDGCGKGGIAISGGAVLAVLAAGAVLAARRAIERTIAEVIQVAEITLISVVVAASITAIAAGTVLAVRARRRYAATGTYRVTARPVRPAVASSPVRALPAASSLHVVHHVIHEEGQPWSPQSSSSS